MRKVLFAAGLLALATSAGALGLDAEGEARVDALLSKMSLDEQIGQLVQYGYETGEFRKEAARGVGGSFLNIVGAEKTNRIQRETIKQSPHGIPLLFAMDVIHGYRTIFPVPLAESCSWEPSLAYRTSAAAAEEARAYGLRWTFAPMVDIGRDPRWGRVMEGAGEDPVLGAAFAAARVRGFESQGLLACVKHFAGYGAAEAGRDYAATDIPLRKFFDVYLPPFEAGIEAGATTLMSGFNTLNGVPVSGSRFLMTDILRGRWGFKGFVVSDWGSVGELIAHGTAANGVEAARQGLWAGIDMDMHAFVYRDHAAGLVKKGLLKKEDVRRAARRILRAKMALGLFDQPMTDPSLADKVTLTPEKRALAREAAIKSSVLLKNDGTLPLDEQKISRLAVIGPLADSIDDPLGPWSGRGDAKDVVSLVQGFRNRLGAGKVQFEKGCDVIKPGRAGFAKAVEAARRADAVVLVLGENRGMSGEAHSRTDIGLPGEQRALAEAVLATGRPVAVVLTNGRPLAIPWLAEKAPAILETWYLGVEAGNAVADLVLGRANPEGKLTMTFPRSVGQIPIYHSFLNTGRPKSETNKYTTRYLDSENTPLYAFGHGLSYTRFRYSGLSLPSKTNPGDTVEVSVTLRNEGRREGAEVAQLYLQDTVASVSRPVRELKAFQKVRLKPGEKKKVVFRLRPRDLAFYGRDMRFGYEPGEFKVYVGGSSEAELAGKFVVRGKGEFVELAPSPVARSASTWMGSSGVREETKKSKAGPVVPEATGPTAQ